MQHFTLANLKRLLLSDVWFWLVLPAGFTVWFWVSGLAGEFEEGVLESIQRTYNVGGVEQSVLRFDFSGHTYLRFGGGYATSVLHDPDCHCLTDGTQQETADVGRISNTKCAHGN